MSSQPFISFAGVSKSYDGVHAVVEGLDLDVAKGEFVSLLGPSGSGKTTALLAVYPTHLITLTPGYFWYLVLQPRGVGQVHIRFGGGLAPEFVADPRGAEYMATLKQLLDEVNAEDRRGVEAVFRGVHAPLAKPGHLSHLERPNYDFARYIAQRLAQ